MTPNLDDDKQKNRVMSRENLMDDHNRYLSYEHNQLMASVADSANLRNSGLGHRGMVNYSKYNEI